MDKSNQQENQVSGVTTRKAREQQSAVPCKPAARLRSPKGITGVSKGHAVGKGPAMYVHARFKLQTKKTIQG